MLKMSKLSPEGINLTPNGNQRCQNKSRSVLSRTLVVVLNPLSEVFSARKHQLTFRNIGTIFEDFKQCNKHSINVLLREAVDDIDLVGWISPFTLLLHGSSEDMNTIEQAWIGRVLKPPEGFVIKDFGEIPTLNMEQISQSQFISISKTLLQIITSLNENQISATPECVMSRLCNSFDSIVIPPFSAIRKSLDLLIKNKKLDVVNDSYYVIDGQNSNIVSKAFSVADSSLSMGSGCHVNKNQENNANEVFGRNIQLSKLKASTRDFDMEVSKTKRDLKMLGVKKSKEIKRKRNIVVVGRRNKEGEAVTIATRQKKKKNKMTRRDKDRSQPSLKSSKLNYLCPQGNYALEKFDRQSIPGHLKTESLSSSKKKKPLSFFGKFSRMFKRTSFEQDETKTNKECLSGLENRSTDDDQYLMSNERVKLVPDKSGAKISNKELKTKRKKKENAKKRKNNVYQKRRDHEDQDVLPKQPVCKEGNCANRYKILRERENVTSSRNSQTKRHGSLPSSGYSCSSNDGSCWRDLESLGKNINLGLGKHKGNNILKLIDMDYDIDSSLSELSHQISNCDDCEYSLSSDTCFELTRQPYRCGGSTSANNEDFRGRCAQDFCSTQAIYGDFELSTLSLNPVGDVKRDLFLPVMNGDMATAHKSQIGTVRDLKRQSGGETKSELQSRNLLQLIGVL